MQDIELMFNQTIDYLFSKLPYFSRDGKKSLKYSLDKIILMSEKLGNPHRKFNTIHVAGTNGKGSVCNSIAAVLQYNGYKTALYTSPHLIDFRERMRVNGKMVEKEFVINFVNNNKTLIDDFKPSFFEITQLIAFSWFAAMEVEIAIIETGLGGRLDSTNIIEPQLSIITNISFDHTDILGDTLEKIASEKSGIIKQNTPVVIGRFQPHIHFVFENKAKEQQSKLYKSIDFDFDTNIDFQLKGNCQKENFQTILAALKVLETDCGYLLDEEKNKYALEHIKELTGLRGRWDILQNSNPRIIADTGHNEDGLRQITEQLRQEKYKKLHFIIGMMEDKNREKLWSILPKNAYYYFCKPNVPRGMDANELMKEAILNGFVGESFLSCKQALSSALDNVATDDLIFIGGSTFVVAELIEFPLIINI